MIERIKNIINPEAKQIDEMSSNEMIELLIKLNQCLRCLDSEEVRSDGMIAGDMVAPTREVQDKVLDYLMNNISKIQDKRSKAAITYYTLLNLHMFSDGNKRLALSLSTQFLLLNGYLKIASRFIVDMENISYHVAAGKISKEFLHEIFESYFDGTFESEEMKLKIYEAISENSLVEV